MGQVDLAHKGGGIALDTARILGMVNAVKQRLDSIGERCRVKAQKHLDRLG